jgi:NADH-quinone oxidoreductase subunit G
VKPTAPQAPETQAAAPAQAPAKAAALPVSLPVIPLGTPQTPPPPIQKMVKVEVDGRIVEADARDNLIEAARRINVSIPYFCYHPRLSIAGQCRMCLVETSESAGRLVPGCQVRVKEGLKITTNSPAVRENQRGIMEFHLINHPVDCAICDQSGECKLQDYYMEYDHQATRIRTFKLQKPKRVELGPMVVYDGERCIMCTRCVRFMDEVAQKPQLAVVNRGDHSLISTFPGQELDSKYSGNTVDVCPVGALLNRDFRFTSRVWYLNKSPSVCTGCANGCNIYVESRGNVAYRELPRRNEEVNQVWMCDEGRLTHHPVNEGRLEWARSGRGDAAVIEGPEQAVERAVALLSPLKGKGPTGLAQGVAVLVSAQCTTEEAAGAFLLAKELGASRAFLCGNADGASDDFLLRADKNPNRRGAQIAADAYGFTLEPASALAEAREIKALIAARLDGADALAAAFARLEVLVAIAQHDGPAAQAAHVALPCASAYEQDGTFVNWYGRLQRLHRSVVAPRGDAVPAWVWARRILEAMGTKLELKTAAHVFALLAGRAPELAGLELQQIADEGLTLPGPRPTEWPTRAPRPPQAYPASGGSR